MLDRLESILITPEQVADHADALEQKIDESWYPSDQIMNRLERILALAYAAAA